MVDPGFLRGGFQPQDGKGCANLQTMSKGIEDWIEIHRSRAVFVFAISVLHSSVTGPEFPRFSQPLSFVAKTYYWERILPKTA